MSRPAIEPPPVFQYLSRRPLADGEVTECELRLLERFGVEYLWIADSELAPGRVVNVFERNWAANWEGKRP
jgi:hypothetical protein